MSSPCLIDLSSNVIPVDDDEDEETYDDIEGLVTSALPMLPNASQISRGGGHEALEAEEDGEDIYEELPGKRMLQWKQHPGWSLSIKVISLTAFHAGVLD